MYFKSRKNRCKTRINRYKTRKNTYKTNRNKRYKSNKKGGSIEKNYNIKIIELCKSIIENLHIIYSLPHLLIIDPELNKLNKFLEELLDYMDNDNNNTNTILTINNTQLYEYINIIYEKYKLKLYHFNDKKKYSTSSLLFMNILEEEILLIRDMIILYNKLKNTTIMSLKDMEIITNRYNNICNEFISQVPCLEQFVTTIYPRVIKPIEDLLEKENKQDIQTNINVIKNNVKEKMNKKDFKYDGDFEKYYNPIYELHQNILLSLISFRKSLCNHENDCEKNNIQTIRAYNEDNYKEYLEFIQFFNNEKFKTLGIDWNQLKNIFNSYLLDLPNPSDYINDHMCCLHELKDSQQQIIGGRKRKP